MQLRLQVLSVLAAGALLSSSVGSAGSLTAERAPSAKPGIADSQAPVAMPWRPDPALETQREALHQHLKDLGIPSDAAAAILVRIDGAAQQHSVPAADIARVADLAADPEAAAKAASMLTAFAELATFGQPLSGNLEVQGAPRIASDSWDKEIGAGEIVLPGFEPTEPLEPRIGGACLACPSFDFGPFTPTAAYQFHSSSTSPGFNDCAWYAMNVVSGNRYEFTLCSPGAATWDSVIEVYDPTDCVNYLRRNDDCSAAPIIRQSTLLWDASFTGVANVKVRGFSSSNGGAYTMAYRTLGVVCETCAVPNAVALAAPQASPQCKSGTTTPLCPSHFYEVLLVAGETYQFTTCPAISAGALATYDTLLRLWSPACGVLVSNDDSCSTAGSTTRSTINFTATTTGTHRIEVSGRTLSNGTVLSGDYVMCYRRTSAACATCSAGPYLGTLTPLPACQQHSSNVTACQDSWYQFVLTGGVQYEFTTCSIAGGCVTGGASFDTVLELLNSGCGAVATNDDGCGGSGSKIDYTVPSASGGVYRLLVRGKSGATGTYTLTYREVTQACEAPTVVNVAPTTGTTGSVNCSRTETFTLSVDAAATLPVTYTWSITPPPGGVAAPPNGTVTSASPLGAASFTTTLSREGTYSVSVTATNACGSSSRTIAYLLVDGVSPTITAPPSSTVECDAVPPPASPTVRDNCDPSPAVAMTETITPGSCPGSYTIRRQWVATDRSGNVSSTAVQVIAVRDRTAPVLTSDLGVKYCAYPPNHDVVCFDRTMFSPTVADNCSLPVTWTFSRVTSSEEGLDPCGSGNMDPDVFVAPDGQTFCVRVERCGNDPAMNDGRRYLVEGVATDACGNTSAPMPIGFVLVPHDSADTSGCIYPTPIPLP